MLSALKTNNKATVQAAIVRRRGRLDQHLEHHSYDTPLTFSVHQGRAYAVRMLLDNGASPDATTAGADRSTPLHLACTYNHPDCVKLLLQANADVDKSDFHGRTPLYHASYYGNIACVELLCAYGASRTVGPPPNGRGVRSGVTANQVAESFGHTNVATWLVRTDAWNPFHFDFVHLTPRRVRALLRSRADPNAPPAHGEPSPIERARALTKQTKVARVLLAASELWRPETHELFPPAARKQAVELVRLGRLLAAAPGFVSPGFVCPFESMYDAWRLFVLPQAIGTLASACRRYPE